MIDFTLKGFPDTSISLHWTWIANFGLLHKLSFPLKLSMHWTWNTVHFPSNYLTFAVYIPANRRLWTALYSDLWVYRNPSWVKAQLHSIKTRYHSAHDKKSNCYLRICLVLLFAKLPLVPCNATKEGWLVYLPCTKFKPAFWRQVFFDLCDSC